MSGSCDFVVVEQHGRIDVVRFRNGAFVGMENLQALAECLTSIIENRERPLLVIDFSGLRHVSSGMLGLLAAMHVRARKREGRLAVCGLEELVLETFRRVDLDKLLPIHPALDDAIAAFAD